VEDEGMEDVEVESDGAGFCGGAKAGLAVIRSGRRGGRADSAAFVRCWFDVLRQDLRALITPSLSGIYMQRHK
jgi:hypothetical protein